MFSGARYSGFDCQHFFDSQDCRLSTSITHAFLHVFLAPLAYYGQLFSILSLLIVTSLPRPSGPAAARHPQTVLCLLVRLVTFCRELAMMCQVEGAVVTGL